MVEASGVRIWWMRMDAQVETSVAKMRMDWIAKNISDGQQ